MKGDFVHVCPKIFFLYGAVAVAGLSVGVEIEGFEYIFLAASARCAVSLAVEQGNTLKLGLFHLIVDGLIHIAVECEARAVLLGLVGEDV